MNNCDLSISTRLVYQVYQLVAVTSPFALMLRTGELHCPDATRAQTGAGALRLAEPQRCSDWVPGMSPNSQTVMAHGFVFELECE